MKKYDFAVQYINPANGCTETMTITGCDSFDEAIRLMEKAKKDRDAQFKPVFVPPVTPSAGSTSALPDMVKTYSDRDMDIEVPNNIPTTNSQKQPA